MKVTSQQPTDSDLKSRKATGADHPSTTDATSPSGTRSFASVLDSVETAGESPRAERDREDGTLQTGESAPRTIDGRDRDKPRDKPRELVSSEAATAPLPAAVSSLEPGVDEIATARQILSVRDLDSVVLTIKNFPGHQPQAVIDLPHSVLQGLRVRLSEDSLGRINAEFLVRTEAIKTQIEGRAADLIELLRFRGVNLAALKTSVSAEFSSGNPDSGQRFGGERPRAIDRATDHAARVDSPDNAEGSVEEQGTEADRSRSYRA